MNHLLAAAIRWLNSGCAVYPVRPDGSKAPAVPWRDLQPTVQDVIGWFSSASRYDGLGVGCGARSGHLEMLELEGRAVFDDLDTRLDALMDKAGLADVWERVTAGYCEQTPSGGLHYLYRVSDGPALGNTKLAARPGPDGKPEVLLETRGEGGFVVVAPSGGRTHPSGEEWGLVAGSPETVATITAAERDDIHDVCRLLDQMPIKAAPPTPAIQHKTDRPVDGALRPGDDYNNRATWGEILTPLGWVRVFAMGDGWAWRRPGKNQGISATTGTRGDGDNLYVWSTSTDFAAETPYSKFGAYALIHHGGDHTAAARELGRLGYGTPAEPTVAPADPADPFGTGMPSAAPSGAAQAPTALAATSDTPEAPVAALEAMWAAQPDDLEFDTPEDPMLLAEIRRQQINREARRHLDAIEAARTFREPPYRPTLTEELLIPDEDVTYTFDKIMPSGANVLLTAQFKAGKTTLVNQAAKAVADGTPFLGCFDTARIDGRVALFNYEVDDRQYRRWLRKAAIKNTDRVVVLNLRGYRLPITTKSVEDWVVEWLKRHDVAFWVVDPFARAFVGCGTSENDNTEVGAFLDTLDVIKERAGVSDLILPTHTGRAEMEQGAERARGATRLDDWADVRWLLTRVDDDRFLSATGRDVDVGEALLTFDPATGSLTYGGGDRRWVKGRRDEDIVLQAIIDTPGISSKKLREMVRAAGLKGENTKIDGIALGLVAARKVRVEDPVVKGDPRRHFPLVEVP